MTKETTWEGKEVLIVEVPEGCNSVDRLPAELWFYADNFFVGKIDAPSDYRFAFIDPLKPTEKEAGEWVEAIPWLSATLYTDYYKPQRDYRDIIEAAHNTAIPSLYSRIKAEGFDNPERVIVLIKNM